MSEPMQEEPIENCETESPALDPPNEAPNDNPEEVQNKETADDGALGDGLKDIPLDKLFDDEMDVDDAGPLGPEEYRHLAQYDDPWSDLKDPHVMMNFYRRIFPWKQLFLWLNQDHVPNYLFTHREFAITLQNDAYLRYNSYANYVDLQKDIIRLNPTRFEIGPAYSAPPKDRKTLPKASFKPILRELVFDIDLTDYDDIRRCCSDKKICIKCWKFISLAIQVLDFTLRQDFGYKHLLWVYSGRRGAHCWVSDEEAMRLTDEQRKAIVSYINIMKGGGSKFGLKVDLKSPLHPMVERSLMELTNSFLPVVLRDQEVFKEEDKWKFLLRIWSDTDLTKKFEQAWLSDPEITSEEKWKAVLNYYKPSEKEKTPNHSQKKLTALRDVINNVILHYTYPRIDLEVSKHLNHLLKSPFCVHPATGKVCVPLDPKNLDTFDPDKVPDVRDLLRELDKHPSSTLPTPANPSASVEPPVALNWHHTSLRPYVEFFQEHVNGLLKDRLQIKKDLQTDSLEF
ncbi:uncharacterized protein PGTG_20567 [Puccinia graminis f. sp. tritici CRL 75-36-700-3]|uniref:DNA primase n=1 Tax=Puccinia graminis f. sp. tritici (strain CRL 75-36-700-3 / race SCCL) TaxID=418459 RepID=E3NYG2_PUCGT|nr:uncharacterized protein PGTG_20567 [Puccinia graminis f. sp. tritici CRL 75-36-700-3]EFP94611.2 hypothetical protein PGTG_20567 [Puccinia graminis f. sp. tritici CRL 75-36-700-3]